MKIKYLSKISLLLLFSMIIATSCTSSFDEVNTDPDSPTTVAPTNELANVIYQSSSDFFDEWFDLNESCTFSGQICKLQYIDESRYEFRASTNNNEWYYLYRTQNTVVDLIKNAQAAGNTNLSNVGKIWKAQLAQITTDRWRDVPYSDMCKASTGTYSPKYDTQETIYPALLSLLKEAADSLALSSATGSLGTGDVLYSGDLTKWKKYCNSLRLRIAMRISGIDPTLAKSTVEEILKNPATYPIITSNDDNAFYKWTGVSEPWAAYYLTRPDEYGVSDVMINTLSSLKDPRLPVYALPTKADTLATTYRGYVIGDTAEAVVSKYSHIGTRFMAHDGLTGFTPYFRACETYFTISEANMLGWNTGSYGTQESAYDKAVTLSLTENSVSDADIATYLAGKGKYDGTSNQLYLQEWISLFKQGMEAWSLYRRTGVPTSNYIAPGSTYALAKTHKTPPLRYPYPQTELDLNTINVKSSNADVVDNYWGKPMWWDLRNADK